MNILTSNRFIFKILTRFPSFNQTFPSRSQEYNAKKNKTLSIILKNKMMISKGTLTTVFSPVWAPSQLYNNKSSSSSTRVKCSSSAPNLYLLEKERNNASPMTGGAYDFEKATTSLTQKLISSPKKVTLVRHGLSSWNLESRVQGSSDLSVLTETGIEQAEKCRKALANIKFDKCFSSPISRAKSTAEVLWQGKEEPLIFLDSLKEGHLFFLEGMKNVDAREKYPKEYITWREDPCNFSVNGVYPLHEIWKDANLAWKEILVTPGENFLVVTHKSILRALICTALGLGPERFRAIDVNNGGVSVFNINKQGEAMLTSLNMTAHMYTNHVYFD